MEYALRKKEVSFMMTDKMITLNNGVKIPQLGLETWFIEDNAAAEAVKAAVSLDTIISIRHRLTEMK
jgi:hypothetical protein